MKVRYKYNEGSIVEKAKDLYCPGCGAQEVYVQIGEGDYYTGPPHYCKSCKCEFSLPFLDKEPPLVEFIE